MGNALQVLNAFLDAWPEPRPPADDVIAQLRDMGLPAFDTTGTEDSRLWLSRSDDGSWVTLRSKDGRIFEAQFNWPAMDRAETKQTLAALQERPNAVAHDKFIRLGAWQLSSTGTHEGWFVAEEAFTLEELARIAQEYLAGSDSDGWRASRRLDRLSEPRHDEASFTLEVPRGMFGTGDMESQWNAGGHFFDDRLGERWVGHRRVGWRAGNRWVLLEWPRFSADFSLRMADVLAGAIVDNMVPASPGGLPRPDDDVIAEIAQAMIELETGTPEEVHAALQTQPWIRHDVPPRTDGPNHVASLTTGGLIRCRARDNVVYTLDVHVLPENQRVEPGIGQLVIRDVRARSTRWSLTTDGQRLLLEYGTPEQRAAAAAELHEQGVRTSLSVEQTLTLIESIAGVASWTRDDILDFLIEEGLLPASAKQDHPLQIEDRLAPNRDEPNALVREQCRPAGGSARIGLSDDRTMRSVAFSVMAGSDDAVKTFQTTLRRKLSSTYGKASRGNYTVHGASVTTAPYQGKMLEVSIRPPWRRQA